ncbi:BA14K family protein [Pseudorhizobium pelagicum]|uniref:BA14K family protein n=1 Tax=Pseudorhizobium pelagicum TaxID=1509405 RepID=UPI00069140E8|nr:BA14K family protein [Pseudorhizobium pelagicum]
MKTVLTILGGLSLSVAAFGGGLVAATVFFSAGEENKGLASADATDLWTNHPVKVEQARTDLDRLPSRATPPERDVAANEEPFLADLSEIAALDMTGATPAEVDPNATGSIAPDQETAAAADRNEPLLSEAHLEWCSSRYRSYRPRDNSYTPYSGGRKKCDSPFSAGLMSNDVASADAVSPLPAESDRFPEEIAAQDDRAVEQAALERRPTSYGTSEHAESCFARYRSYRPEDNTYQPYGGGPRRQCQ